MNEEMSLDQLVQALEEHFLDFSIDYVHMPEEDGSFWLSVCASVSEPHRDERVAYQCGTSPRDALQKAYREAIKVLGEESSAQEETTCPRPGS